MPFLFSILIVEDEILIAQDVKEILEEVGYKNATVVKRGLFEQNDDELNINFRRNGNQRQYFCQTV